VDYNCHFSLSFAYIGYRVSSTDHRPLITEYRLPTTETLTLTWTTTVIFHYHLPILTTESRVSSLEYRLPTTETLTLTWTTTVIFHYHLPILTTESRVSSTDYRLPTTETLTLMWTTTVIFHYHLPILTTESRVSITDYRLPSTEYWVPTTDHRVLSTEYQSPSTKYRVLTNTICVHLKYQVSCFDTRHLVICAMSGKWTCCIHIFGSRASGFGTQHSELDDLCNVNEQWTCYTLGFKFHTLALKTQWFVQWVKNEHVVYLFSGPGLRWRRGIWTVGKTQGDDGTVSPECEW
jgi:hypothetical protein